MPANDTVTTETPAVPTVSPRFILVMAGQLAAQAEGLLSDALTTLDLTDDPEGIDETIAPGPDRPERGRQAGPGLQAGPGRRGRVRPARRLPDRRRHDPRPGRSVHPVRGDHSGGLRPPRGRDLGLRSPGGSHRGRGRGRGRRSARRPDRGPPAGRRPGHQPQPGLPVHSEQWADSLAAAEAEAGQAIEDAANPLAEEPAAATDEGQAVVA